MKVRCNNCDAVIDAHEEKTWDGIHWRYLYECYHCHSTDTVKTDEPYRMPREERTPPPPLGVIVSDSTKAEDKTG